MVGSSPSRFLRKLASHPLPERDAQTLWSPRSAATGLAGESSAMVLKFVSTTPRTEWYSGNGTILVSTAFARWVTRHVVRSRVLDTTFASLVRC